MSVRPEQGIQVAPPGASPYRVIVEAGVLARAAERVAAAAPAARYAVITDANVAPLYGAPLAEALRALAPTTLHSVPPGEASKSRRYWAELGDALLAAGLGRDGCVVALGGGVVGDLAGFVAATHMRGVPVVQAPTSLLAMVDASVGGKTGLDVAAGKNLVGAFHQPRLVLVDPAVLATLPVAELRAGLAEAVKHGLIADAAYLAGIERDAAALLARDAGALGALVRRSVAIKAAVVERDPLEAGERAVLNAGHTVAHAIEQASDYAVRHGHAVAMGLVAEARAGEAAGVTAAGTAAAVARVLAAVGLPRHLPAGLAADEVLRATATDKKGRGGRPRYALPAAVGRMAGSASEGWTHALDDAHVLAALHARSEAVSAGAADV